MVRIAWRDLAGWASLEETLSELSVVRGRGHPALRTSCARQSLVARYGEPRSPSGEAQPLIVLGMGKLGGGELNFSSDIDLVLLFPEHGETDGARSIANEEFFTRLGQELIRLLEDADARWLRVPRGHAPAPVRRQRRRRVELRVVRGLPAASRPRLGALRVREGARRSRRASATRRSTRTRSGRSSIAATSTTACSRACAR